MVKVLINILPIGEGVQIVDRFESNFLGLQARQDYRVINLWEVDASMAFDSSINALLPFVPVLRNGGDPEVVRQALNQMRQDTQMIELEPLLGFFASFVLGSNVVQQIMRWDMAVLHESPWYQQILKEGESSIVLKQRTRKVGLPSPEVTIQTQGLSRDDVEALAEALLDFSEMSDLENWLTAHS